VEEALERVHREFLHVGAGEIQNQLVAADTDGPAGAGGQHLLDRVGDPVHSPHCDRLPGG
jgi:hypothetical protein